MTKEFQLSIPWNKKKKEKKKYLKELETCSLSRPL